MHFTLTLIYILLYKNTYATFFFCFSLWKCVPLHFSSPSYVTELSRMVEFGNEVKEKVVKWMIDGVCYCTLPGSRMSFNIREKGTSYCLIPVSITEIPRRWFQQFADRSLFEKCIRKSPDSQNKTLMTGTNSYMSFLILKIKKPDYEYKILLRRKRKCV